MGRLIGLGVCLLVAATACAEVGDLLPAADSKVKPLMAKGLFAYGKQFKKAKAGSGTTWPKAIVAQVTSGGARFVVAIDAKDPAAKVPDLMRIDFSGKGRFNDEHVLPLKNTNSNGTFYSKVGPAVLQVTRAGKTIPARGDNLTVDAASSSFDEPFAVRSGVSQRFIADLSDLGNSVTIHTTGQSGQLFHPHREDFISPWQNVEYHPMLFSREAVEANAEAVLTLRPQ